MSTSRSFLPRRLSKFVSEATSLSHRKIRRAHEDGRILVRAAGDPLPRETALSILVFGEDRVFLDGLEIVPTQPSTYALLNKPIGVVSTTDDPSGRSDLSPWLGALSERAFPVGRLDAQTTGALLLTDDGDLSYLLLSPLFHIEKRYHLHIDEPLAADDPRLEQLRQGVDIGDGKGPARAVRVDLMARGDSTSHIGLTLDEGRNRQIRKMCRVVRLRLKHLHRVAIGPLLLGDLEAGEVRALERAEVDALYDAAGGRNLPRERAIEALVRRAELWREQGRAHARLDAWLRGELENRAG